MIKPFSFLRKPIPLVLYAVVLSILNLVLYNIPFFSFAASHSEKSPFFIVCSLVLLMLALTTFVNLLFIRLTNWVWRSLICVTNICSSAPLSFVVIYNVIMDDTMMSCFYNTRPSEAAGFMNAGLWLTVLVLGVLPSLWLIFQRVKMCSWRKWFVSLGTTLGVSVIVVLLNLNNFLWIGKYDTELGGLIMPWSYIVNTGRLISQHNAENEEAIPLPDGHFTDTTRTAVVLVIGESARADHFQLYGYERATNPRLAARGDLRIFTCHSNYTFTTASVRCILQPDDTPELYETLPDYLSRMGADVQWRTSNWGEPPLHIKDYVTDSDLEEQYPGVSHDELLLQGVKERIVGSAANKVFVVLHTSTSHGPCYDSKYPDGFRQFTPVARDVESADKDIPGLVNAYDNSVLYTDYLLDSLIGVLQGLEGWRTAMVYVSDHGESLGENDLFMHGVPRGVAPREQYVVPFILWVSDPGRWEFKPRGEVIDQTAVFSTVVRLLGLETEAIPEGRSVVREIGCKGTTKK